MNYESKPTLGQLFSVLSESYTKYIIGRSGDDPEDNIITLWDPDYALFPEPDDLLDLASEHLENCKVDYFVVGHDDYDQHFLVIRLCRGEVSDETKALFTSYVHPEGWAEHSW